MAEQTRANQGRFTSVDVPYPTKAQLPAQRTAIVHRQRLIGALVEGTKRRVSVVSAPPGYGKTTLLLDFAHSSAQKICWYSLDERDRDPVTFLKYFVAAGRANFPGFGEELAQAIESAGAMTPSQITDLLVSATASAGEPFTFILDDFHCLDAADPEFRAAIEGWIYRLPPDVHVVLSARTHPQIAVLPMMTVRQEVSTITAADFSFSCDEVALLFRDVLGKDVSLDDSQRLADLTEGWAGALILMADKVQTHGPAALEQLRSSDTLYQYIDLEQFEPQDPELKEFLRASAVLRTQDVAFVNDLLGIADAEEKLGRLAQNNLVVPPGDPSQPYRYPHLMRAFLVSNLRGSDAARFRELNMKAAAISEQAGRWDDAVYHYIQAGAWESIVQVADRHGSRMFEEGRWDTLAEWLDAIPADELAREPKLTLWKARVLHYLNQTDKALALLTQAVQVSEAGGDWETLAEALTARGMSLRVKGDYEPSREALVRARDILVEHGSPQALITEARKELGMTLSRCGDFSESIQELQTVVGVYETNGDQYNIAHAGLELANSLALSGRLAEAAVTLERVRGIWSQLGNDHFLIQTLNSLGVSYYLAGNFDKAEAILQQGVQVAQRTANLKWEMYLVSSIADIKRDQGELQQALDAYSSLLEQAWAVNDAYIRIYLMDAVAGTHRLLGDISAAESWSARAIAEAEKTGGALEMGMCLITSAQVKRQKDDLKSAVSDLERAITYLKDKGSSRELVLAHFHLAGVYFSLKKKSLALESLEKCAELVKGLGYDHFLVVEAARNPLLVQYASANKLADGYFTRMLKLIKAPAAGESEPDGEVSAEQAASAAGAIYAFGFGHLRVEMGGREITDLEWRSEKSKEMFFFFMANRRALRKEEIVAALWPDMPDAKTTSAFHSNMYRLRKALYQDVIAKESGRYILDPQATFTFDVDEYQKALQQAHAAAAGSREAIAAMEKALSLYTGPFAADFYSEWAQTLRYQLEEQQMGMLATLAATYSETGEYKKSAEVCQKILDVDEFNEAAWYRLMSNYILSDQGEAAKYCYNRYVQIVSEGEMDEDLPDFEELVREITGGKPLR
ncbi:MAG TPA: tetratricopeptide repeat protein [Dehalococcoidia bacterium]|nr:tetratricopeptide repeat protein [Dehalococcoidia bacterium]